MNKNFNDARQETKLTALLIGLLLSFYFLAPVGNHSAFCQGFVGNDKLTGDMIATLEHPSEMEVYSLDAKETTTKPNFHGWKLFGSTLDHDGQSIKSISQHLIQKTNPKSLTFCQFQPHHGISVRSKEHRLDYVICFHCTDILIFYDGDLWNRGLLDAPNINLERLLNTTLQRQKIPQAADYLHDYADRNR